MVVIWELDDGHVGKTRFKIEIPDDELEEYETEDEKEELINEYVQADFEEKISWNIVEKG